ncbi:MAG TPA: tRNA(His) guanylyltransferase Thg1 family protein [Methanoregula sp.]|nr:tRNA(His) guanylyltransferase Thg1 family protein [Methanoregula sp.]
MDSHEIFSGITTIPPVFIRLDGRSFHRLTAELGLGKPFDDFFHKAMVAVTTSLVTDSGLSPVFAFTFSDEISLYLTKLPFGGRVEKIDSVAASFAASALTIALGCIAPVAFDARIVQATPEFAAEYLISRQAEAWRNHINGYCQQALIGEGMSAREAAARLKGMPAREMHEMMFARGINLAGTPAWQRRGVLVHRETCEKGGFNPLTEEEVVVERSAVVEDRDLPLFSSPEGKEFLARLVCRE